MNKFPVKWLTYTLIIDVACLIFTLVFPGSDEIIYLRFLEKQAISFISAMKLTGVAFLALASYQIADQLNQVKNRAMFAALSSSFFFLAIDEWFFVRERIAYMLPYSGELEKIFGLLYFCIGTAIFLLIRTRLEQFRSGYWCLLIGGVLFALKISVGVLDQHLGLPVAYFAGGALKLLGESLFIVGFIEILRLLSLQQITDG